jgi:RecB family endonuclease NucS
VRQGQSLSGTVPALSEDGFALLSEVDDTVRSAVRLIVARCEVRYTGRLTAVLPASTRLLILKSDGSVLIHADAGGYKPLNCAP